MQLVPWCLYCRDYCKSALKHGRAFCSNAPIVTPVTTSHCLPDMRDKTCFFMMSDIQCVSQQTYLIGPRDWFLQNLGDLAFVLATFCCVLLGWKNHYRVGCSISVLLLSQNSALSSSPLMTSSAGSASFSRSSRSYTSKA